MLLSLHKEVLGGLSLRRYRETMRGKNSLALGAFDGERLIAYKAGFPERPERFYSWIGGVHPDYRRLGLAKKLTESQHAWLLERGFRKVRTLTSNQNIPMIMLNLATGFLVIGCQFNRNGLSVLMERDLQAPSKKATV